MNSRAITALLASIAILLFSLTLVFAAFVALLLDVAPRLITNYQGSLLPVALLLVGLVAALVAVAIGYAGLVEASGPRE